MQRWLIALGAVVVLIGLLWPWIAKLGLSKLPGDIAFERNGTHFYFPITTSIIISIVISIVLWLLRK